MLFSAPLPAVTTLAVWLVVGVIYLWHIQRFKNSQKYVRRTPNYRHFSHALIAVQIAGVLTGLGQMPAAEPVTQIALWLGLFVGLAGFALCLWAKVKLGRFWDRHASIQEGHELVRTGPYAWCRNPIFLGQFGLFVGAGVASLNGIALLCCAPALWSFYHRIRTEETLLADHFGQDYERYLAEVPRFWPVPMLQVRPAPDLLETRQKV